MAAELTGPTVQMALFCETIAAEAGVLPKRRRRMPKPRTVQDPDDPANADDPGPHRNSVLARKSVVVGVTRLAWLYGKSRDFAESLLREWEVQQELGTAPVRVFRKGRRRSLFTTMAVLHATMPPGRDLVLYGRMKDAEEALAMDGTRIDREIIERKQAVAALERRVAILESRRKPG